MCCTRSYANSITLIIHLNFGTLFFILWFGIVVLILNCCKEWPSRESNGLYCEFVHSSSYNRNAQNISQLTNFTGVHEHTCVYTCQICTLCTYIVSIYLHFKTYMGRGLVYVLSQNIILYPWIKAQAVLLVVVPRMKLNYSNSL